MNYRRARIGFSLIAVFCGFALAGMAQQMASGGSSTTSSTDSAVVPRLVNYSGVLTDVNGKPLTGVVGVTFTLYQESEGGTPLWTEMQNVQASKGGHYSAMLGSTSSEGLPQDVFVSGEARWLGVQIEGQAEQPRVLLVAVPYALKAGDAETIGGLPASAFMLANGAQGAAGGGKPATAAASSRVPSHAPGNVAPGVNPAVTGKGTAGYIPMWDTASDIIDSVIFQKTSAIGIGTTAPAATLDVSGKADVRDTLTLFPKSTDNTLAVSGTTFNISSTGKVTFISGQTFPGTGTITGITTASGSGLSGGGTTGTLALKVSAASITNAMLADSKITLNASTAGGLSVPGAMTLGDTYTIGLKACSTDQILKYNGTTWACATAGAGTVTSVATGLGLNGGTITTSGTLSINTAVVPQLAAANTFTNSQTIDADVHTPLMNLTNTGSGDGIDVSVTAGDGLNVTSRDGEGVVGTGAFEGGYFSGSEAGTYSYSNSNSDFNAGVFGAENGGTQETFGVEGFSASTVGIGVYGRAVESSNTGADTDGGFFPMGVWGDSGAPGGIGAFASADNGWAFVGYNNSPSGDSTAWFENEETNDSNAPVLFTYGSNYGGTCTADVSGNLICNGVVSGVASVAGGSKKVALNAIQSPENWFEDAGSGQLSGGEAVVNIESVFGETVNTGLEYHVFLTPNGDCKGLYVAQKSATSFVVRELGGGTSSIAFDYRIMAKRRGFEEVRLADKTQLFSLKNRPIKPAGSAAKHMPDARDVQKRMQEHAQARSVAAVGAPVLNKKP
jgi:hypothetical protein